MKFCEIRKDVLELGLSVPVGNDYISTTELLEYQDDENDDDGFKIKNPKNGKFEDACSVDFENFVVVGSAELLITNLF